MPNPTRLRRAACGLRPGVVMAALYLGTAGCGPEVIPPAEEGDPQLSRLTAPTGPDTVDAVSAVAYSVSVRRPGGAAVDPTSVLFEASNALVSEGPSPAAAALSTTTAADGSAAVSVIMGTAVGEATVVASVPALGLADTLVLEVLPGAADSAALTISDTTVIVGGTFIATASGVDRYGHPVSIAPEIASGPLSAVDSFFTANHFGVAELIAGRGTVRDTATVRAVPDGTIVYTDAGMARLVRFDGSEPETLGLSVPGVQEPSIDWSPDGYRVVVGGTDGFRVYDLLTQTTSPQVWPGGAAGTNIIWPRFGPNGNRIHYSSSTLDGWDIRAADLEAGNASVTIGANVNPGQDLFPDWAPDSSGFVFSADWEETNTYYLRLANPDASVVTTLTSAEAVTPVWSPDGSLIAWQELGEVGVVSPDESVSRSWDPDWSKGVSWSPDGSTLVGLRSGTIAVIDVVTGETMELPELGTGIDAVAWRPTPTLTPTSEPTISRWIVPGASDTIDASLAPEYALVVRGTDGAPLSGISVDFIGTNAQVAPSGGVAFLDTVQVTTDTNGFAAARVRLGTVAGEARVVASVDTFLLADTFVASVIAGVPVGDSLRFPLSDTTIVVGDTIPVSSAEGFDRHGNPTAIAVSVVSGPLSGTGPFVAEGFGDALLVASVAGLADSADVRIVPRGAFVGTSGSDATVMTFDGSESDTLAFSVPSAQERSIDWNGDGTKVVVGSFDGFRVFDLVTESLSPETWPGGTAGTGNVIWPRFGPAGNRIYYSAQAPGGWDLREADLDGGNAAVTIGTGVNAGNDLFPDWAPDSTAFVFTGDWESANTYLLRIASPDGSTTTTLTSAEGVTPVWSPDGNLIAWQELGVVGVVSPDEAVLRTWNPSWEKGVSWSPDSSTLIGLVAGVVAVLDVETGTTMTFPEFGSSFDAVSWRPN